MKTTLPIFIHAVLIFFCVLNVNAQDKFVGENVPADRRVSLEQMNYAPWNAILQAFVNDKGEVNYSGLKSNQAAVQELDQFINSLSYASLTAPASRQAHIVFWINAYNSITIRGILDVYPTTSIRNHTSETGGYNIWKNLKLQVADRQISLESIENDFLRKSGDPRIHFAIVCASHSCPRLLNQAYTIANLEEQLALNTRNFFANPGNFQYDPATRQFEVSKILEWYGTDFGTTPAAQLKALAPYFPNRQAYDAAIAGAANVTYLDYSWALNEYKPTAGSGMTNGSGMKEAGSGMKEAGSGMKEAGSGMKEAGSGMKEAGSRMKEMQEAGSGSR